MINEIEVLSNLIKVDNMIMKDNITVDDVLSDVPFSDISLINSIIIYNGDINDTKKIINSNITYSLLYPNNCYLAINKYLVSKREDLELSVDKNEFNLINKQHQYDNVVVINDKELFNSVKDNYVNIKYIEI